MKYRKSILPLGRIKTKTSSSSSLSINNTKHRNNATNNINNYYSKYDRRMFLERPASSSSSSSSSSLSMNIPQNYSTFLLQQQQQHQQQQQQQFNFHTDADNNQNLDITTTKPIITSIRNEEDDDTVVDSKMDPSCTTTTLNFEHYTYEELENVTNQLLDFLLQSESTTTTSTIVEEGQQGGDDITNNVVISSQYCYKIIEAWTKMILKYQQEEEEEQTVNSNDPKQSIHILMAKKAEQIVNTLEERTKVTNNIVLQPTGRFYDLVLQGYANCCKSTTTTNNNKNKNNQNDTITIAKVAAEYAQNLLNHMITIQQQQRNNKNHIVTTVSYNIVINCWAKTYDLYSGIKAEDLYKQMEKQQQQYPQSQIEPNMRTITGIIDAWTNSGHSKTQQSILQLLKQTITKHRTIRQKQKQQQQRKQQQSLNQLQQLLDVGVFNTVIKALAITSSNNNNNNNTLNSKRQQEWNTAEMAEHVLQLLIQLQKEEEEFLLQLQQSSSSNCSMSSSYTNLLTPTTQTYSMVLLAWAQCAASNTKKNYNINIGYLAAQRAERLLEYMVQLYTTSTTTTTTTTTTPTDGPMINVVKPNYKSFTTCIAAWANCVGYDNNNNNNNKGRQTTNVKRNNNNLNNNNSSSSSSSSSNVLPPEERAERLFRILTNLYNKTNDIEYQPDIATINAVLSAWSRSKRLNAPNKIQQILLDILEQQQQQQQNESNNNNYNNNNNTVDNAGGHGNNSSIMPDLISFNNLLYAYSTIGNFNVAYQLLELLEKDNIISTTQLLSITGYNNNNNSSSSTDTTKTTTTQQQDQSTSSSSSSSGQVVLVFIGKPKLVSYNIVLHALAKNGTYNSAIQAEELLERMEQQERLLPLPQPNIVTYSTVIQAWAKSNHPSSVLKNYNILKRMIRNDIKPDIGIINAVLQTCAKEKENQYDALKIALTIFHELIDDNNNDNDLNKDILSLLSSSSSPTTTTSPYFENNNNNKSSLIKLFPTNNNNSIPIIVDDLIFVTMIDICYKLISRENELIPILKYIFNHCCNTGYVSKRVLITLRAKSPIPFKRLFERLITSEDNNIIKTTTINDKTTTTLPREWSRNIILDHRP